LGQKIEKGSQSARQLIIRSFSLNPTSMIEFINALTQ